MEFRVIIEPVDPEDAKEILDLQKLAFQSEAELYQDYTISPLNQTLEEIKTDFENYVFFKASVDGKIIGSVRACMRKGDCLIGRLIVHPDFQNRGIGTKLMHEIERHFSRAKRFEIFTGHRSRKNIHLYQKLGYQIFRSEPITTDLEFVYMEKFTGRLRRILKCKLYYKCLS